MPRSICPTPCERTQLTLAIPYFAGRTSLRVDGEEAVRVTDDLVVGYRARGPQSFRLPRAQTADGHVVLDLSASTPGRRARGST